MSERAMTQQVAVIEAHRVRALLMKASAPRTGSKRAAVMKLLGWQPLARQIRFEGRCDACKQSGGFMSYVLPTHEIRIREREGQIHQDCAYYCSKCQFGNAGGRSVNRGQ